MPFFMINVACERDVGERTFEVEAENSGIAVLRMLSHSRLMASEMLIHMIHVGAPYPRAIDWPAEDRQFERVPLPGLPGR